MTVFEKDSLNYQYKWSVHSRLTRPTILDYDFIDITNGHDVLNFINHFFDTHGLSSTASVERLEYLMYHHLPINVKSRKEITSWIRKNWDRKFALAK